MNSPDTPVVRKIGKIPVRSTEFVLVTDLVPKKWRTWFYECISNNAPFSWGDNNRSMVTAEVFADHCDNRLDEPKDYGITVKERDNFIKMIRNLEQTYIDLEN